MAAAERALEAAYGQPVARMGSGGSIPLVAKLRETYPDAAFVLWGAQDSDLARIHATGESVDLGEVAQDRARRGAAAGAARLGPARRRDRASLVDAVWNTGTAPTERGCPPRPASQTERVNPGCQSRPCAD